MLNEEKTNVSHSLINFQSELNRRSVFTTQKSALAQFLACFVICFTYMEIGTMLAISTLVIQDLHKSTNAFSLNDEESSWYGSILFLFQPAGCVVSGILQPYVGRKFGMIASNVPLFLSWILLHLAASSSILYLSSSLMGISAGFIEPPGIAYVGEIAEPKFRGMFGAMLSNAICLGFLVEFGLGSVVDWRTAAAISAAFPIINIILLAWIPDSPLWLLTKCRNGRAIKALRWLRGWTTKDKVMPEFEEMRCYVKSSQTTESDEEESWSSIVFRYATLKPLLLIATGHFFSHCAGLTGGRGYLMQIFNEFALPLPSRWLAFVESAFMLAGGCACTVTVKFVEKRKVAMISLTMCATGLITLAVYAYHMDVVKLPWIPMTMFSLVFFGVNFGCESIPWILTSEIFPVKSRSIGAGLAAASYYAIAFVLVKTFQDLWKVITLPGCFLLHGIISVGGILFSYHFLPATNDKTLAEVGEYFAAGSTTTKSHAGV